MGTNFHTAWIDKPTPGYTTFVAADMNAPLSTIDRAVTYLKNIIIHCDGEVTFDPGTGQLGWSDTLRIIFNRADGQAIGNTVAAGSISLSNNEFAYLDLNETDSTVLTMQKAAVTTGAASNFITYNRVVLGYRNTASGRYFRVYLDATEVYESS